MTSNILFINTGTGRNLGDRAMLLNLMENLRAMGVDVMTVPRQLPENYQQEFKTRSYIPYHEYLDRFRRRLSGGIFMILLRRLCYFLHVVFMCFLSIIFRWLPIKPRGKDDENGLLHHLKFSDAVWLSGGGYITDKGSYECRCCLLTAVFAILMGKKIVLTGQGIGPIGSWLTTALLRVVASHSDYISVRDDVRSRELLTQLTKGKVSVVMAGDDASSLSVTGSVGRVSNIRETRIAIHFRISPFTENSEYLKAQFLETVNCIFDRGWRPVFFIFTSQQQWEEDILHSILKDTHPDSYDIVISDDPREIKYRISECHLALGVAYHFVVFCLTTGTPVTALYGGEYYRYKMTGILKQFSKEDWMTEFCEFDPETTIKILDNHNAHLDFIHNDLMTSAKGIIERHTQSTRSAFSVL